ncbi:MAG: phosphoglycerate mutase [Dehalobacter sp. 4CP]|uniref:alkaline phosphatase family protein n=1 Tax=Dehalobacter sp. CP TaxID=2594474 RepID=UPI0013CA8AEC|nr:phosphoglycerate mutase [Dehalobacter sp. 4CP]
MKAVMVIVDGLADEKIEELGWQTTFEAACHPELDQIAAEGHTGWFDSCPQGYLPESMPCILNLLGVKPAYFPQSRASLELLANGYCLEQDEVVLRCNLAALDSHGRLASFNGGNLTGAEMQKAAKIAADIDPNIKMLHLSGYRNLIIVKAHYFQTLDCKTYPPHEFLGDDSDDLLADICTSAPILQKFVSEGKNRLKYLSSQEQQMIFYPWGISGKSRLPAFAELYGKKAAAVCGTEIAKGIALALKMDVPDLAEATGDTDTDLALKAQTACRLLSEYDFVLVHINGTDEAAHRHDHREKIEFIERVDREFFAFLRQNLTDDTGILICADHATSPVSGKHSALDVPYIFRKAGETLPPGDLEANKVLKYLISE